MVEVISVRFNNKGKAYFFDPAGKTVSKGESVVVETAKGLEYGECVYGNHDVEETSVVQPLRPLIRIATDEDRRNVAEGKAKESDAFDYCQKKIGDFGLDMKLVDVEYGFEGNKILFFFTSDGRVDFRELVKDLASMFKTRIELRQIGVRDEARMLGGLGVCGKQFCCSQFLTEFHPVSIKMAKTQGLSLNPTKISGTCGRLMCCLKYEETAYEDLVKKAPKNDAFVETPSGKGSVVSVNLLRRSAKVRLEDGLDTTLKTFTFDELDILGGKARRAEYIAARAEGRLEEAGFKTQPKAPPPPPPPAPARDTQRQQKSAGQDAAPQPGGGGAAKRDQPRGRKPQSGKRRPPPKPQPERAPREAEAPPRPPEQNAAAAPVKKPGYRRHRGGKGKGKGQGPGAEAGGN